MCKGAGIQPNGRHALMSGEPQILNLGKVRSVPLLPHFKTKLAPWGPTCQPCCCQMFPKSARDVWGAAAAASAEPAPGRVLCSAKLLVLARLYTTGNREEPLTTRGKEVGERVSSAHFLPIAESRRWKTVRRHESSLVVAGTSLGYLSLFGGSLSAPKICLTLQGRGWLQGVKVKKL